MQWLEARVVPIFKRKGNPSDPSNYRPISITSSCCKVLETIIRKEMTAFLDSENLIHNQQHGFRQNRSTMTNLMNAVNRWERNVDNNKEIHCAFLDFAKAFDTVSHPKLIHKLERYGLSGHLLKWISIFLSDRSQIVSICSIQSTRVKVLSGVPQGTVLGPLLFIIFANDLPDVSLPSVDLDLFADDTKLSTVVEEKNTSSLPFYRTMISAHTWSDIWQVYFAAKKCSVMCIGSRSTKLGYRLGDEVIQQVTEATALGVLISSNLKFSGHCEKISKSGMRKVGLIYKAFLCRDEQFLVSMFKIFIRPSLEYCSPVFNPYLLKDIDLIENVQRTFTRRIPGLSQLSYPARLIVLKLESLEERRIKFDLIFIYKLIHGLIELNFDDFFVYSQRNYELRRHQFDLRPARHHSNWLKQSISCRPIDCWNKLRADVVNAPNLNAFKRLLNKVELRSFCKGRGIQ